MKIFLIFLLTVSFSFRLSAQDSWRVVLNGKTLLNARSENEERNVIAIKSSELKKKQDFYVHYLEREKKGWERSIMLVAENDQELSRQKGKDFKLKNASLTSLFATSKKLSIYTIALPSDPAKRALVRVRRVHLCTLILKER